MIRSSQHGFFNGKSYLTNLTPLYKDDYLTKQTTSMVDEGGAGDIVYLDFSKGTFKFEQQPHSLKKPFYFANLSMLTHCHVLLSLTH